jgi:hypothetical protein
MLPKVFNGMFIEDPVFMESMLGSVIKDLKENSKIKKRKDELSIQMSLGLLEVGSDCFF